jgi:AcrR family transcriptional regulator
VQRLKEEQPRRKPGRPKRSETMQPNLLILRTAAMLFMEHGFEKVSLEGVAKACRITKASVYYYFDNKAKLFTECLLFVLKIAYDQTALIMRGPGTLKERLLIVAERHMNNAHVEFETMMREAAPGLSEEQIKQIRDGEAQLHILLSEIFAQAMEEGVITKSDPLLLSHTFTAMMTVRNHKQLLNDQKSVKQASAEIVQLLWNGLQPRS